MNDVRYAFLGCTNYSKDLLEYLISLDKVPEIILTIPEYFNISYSENKVQNRNFGDLYQLAQKHGIPCLEVDSVDGKRLKDYKNILENKKVDLLLALGWYYMVPPEIRAVAKYGCWAIHASLLPKYAGGAPLNWAMINGENETGVTLFRMDEGIDDGDIISQISFSIESTETIKDVYRKATDHSKQILKDVLADLDNVEFTPQDKSKIQVYPQRTSADGEIDLSLPAVDLLNFIRAQSSPYPGAFIKTKDGKKLIIENARIEDL